MEVVDMDEQIYTFEDVINSDKHVEMIDGIVIIEDKTTPRHNIAVTEIATSLKNYISSKKGSCVVYAENVALYTNELNNNDGKNYYLPDVMVICDKNGIKDDGIHTVPKFVAEVTSDATRKFDYNQKLEMYKKIGVEEYWIVDLQRNVVFKYVKSEDYIPQYLAHPKIVKVSSYEGLSIDFSTIIQ